MATTGSAVKTFGSPQRDEHRCQRIVELPII